MELVIGALYFLVFLVLLRVAKINRATGLRPWIVPASFALKCGVGLLFLQLYIFQHTDYHLKNDAGAFYREATILNNVASESPADYVMLMTGIGSSDALSQKYLGETNHWDSGSQAIFSDNRNIIRVHALIHLISFDSIVVHMLIFSLISLLGTLLLFLAIRAYTDLKPWIVLALLLLFPNVLFWSSGILKETFVVFGIGAFAYGLVVANSRYKKMVFLSMGAIALVLFKPYILIFALVPFFIFWIYVKIPKYKLAISLGIPLIVGALILLCFPGILYKGTHLLSRKQFDFANVGRGGMHVQTDSCFYYFPPEQYQFLRLEGDSVWLNSELDACKVMHGDLIPPTPIHLFPNSKAWTLYFDQTPANSFVELTPINDDPSRLLSTAPSALASALFRPIPSDPGGKLKYLAFFETLGLFSLIIWTLFRHRMLSVNERGFVLSAIVFCILLGLLIGWTTPVLGAIHRYRLPIQLALIVCICVAWKPNIQFLKHE